MKLITVKTDNQGIASIPTVMALAMLILIIGILITSTSLNENLSQSSSADSDTALSYAQAGATDALELIARNKNNVSSYTIDMVASGCAGVFPGCATVSIAAGSNPKTIISTGRVGTTYRKIQVDATLDSNGLITSYNWQEF